MNIEQHQAILARDIIDMIFEYSNDSSVLEYIEGICFSLARVFDKNSIVDWDHIAGVCDQRYYSLNQNESTPLDIAALNACKNKIAKFISQEHE